MYPHYYHPALADLHFTSTNMILVQYIPTNPPDNVLYTAIMLCTVDAARMCHVIRHDAIAILWYGACYVNGTQCRMRGCGHSLTSIGKSDVIGVSGERSIIRWCWYVVAVMYAQEEWYNKQSSEYVSKIANHRLN